MFHQLLSTWFHWVDIGGYLGIIGLMALESSVVPVPSEVVIAPAAFWASQGRFSLAGVILAGTFGSYLGSAISYWLSAWVGRPFLFKYGKYALISKPNLELAEDGVTRFGVPGVFASRFLPVIRHLISIPAGVLRMSFGAFSAATILGAGIWCAILAWFGQQVLGSRPDLLNSPEAMASALRAKLSWVVIGVIALLALYAVVVSLRRKRVTAATTNC